MPRKPPSYDDIKLPERINVPAAVIQKAAPRAAEAGKTVRDDSDRLTIYINPAAAKALRRYALDQSSPRKKIKVHDLVLEAIEDWFRKHGIQEPLRLQHEQAESD